MSQMVSVCLVALMVAATVPASAEQNMTLNDAAIVIGAERPAYVEHALRELTDYMRSITGVSVPVETSLGGNAPVTIVIGPEMAAQVMSESLSVEALGDEGVFIGAVEREDKSYLVVTGATPAGTKFAISRLMKLIQRSGSTASVECPVSILEKPSIARRGMHFNGWAFGYPYTFRCWAEQDWKSYIDLLTHLGVNVLYIWPFMEIMPVPLSVEDAAYLDEVNRVVEYAQREHGMEVWIMQAVNRVATSNLGVADPRHRPYWRYDVQLDRNPADPEGAQAIADSHDSLYRAVTKADGFCFIDCDPGGWPNSPVSELIGIFQHTRASLNTYNVHGANAKIIHWLWGGWGHTYGDGSNPEAVMKETIQAMKSQLPEPWELICGMTAFLPWCKDEQVLGKTTLLPYNTIEGEPSYPGTNLSMPTIQITFDALMSYPGILGMMGNAQTPLLQFPNIYHFTNSAWDLSYRNRTQAEVLADVAGQLFPEKSTLIADCYAALSATDLATLDSLVSSLDTAISSNAVGVPGVLGRKVFPTPRFVVQALAMQLRLQAAQQHLVQNLSVSSHQDECRSLVQSYLDAYLTWDEAHGWHELWGYGSWALGRFTSDPGFGTAIGRLRAVLGDDESVARFFDEISEALSTTHQQAHVMGNGIEPMRSLVLAAAPPISSLALSAVATASFTDQTRPQYAPAYANDGLRSTLWWPGPNVLSNPNSEWLQLTWSTPQRIARVVVYLANPQNLGQDRRITLQRYVPASQTWQDFAVTVTDENATGAFTLPQPITLDRLRVTNPIDLCEVAVYGPTNLMGTVEGALTGEPVRGARVSAGGVSCQTDEAGQYALSVPSGPVTMSVSRAAYETINVDIIVPLDGLIVWNVLLPSSNVAPMATKAMASAQMTAMPAVNCKDDDLDTKWQASTSLIYGSWIGLEWSFPVTVNRMRLHGSEGGYNVTGLTVQYWDGSAYSDARYVSGLGPSPITGQWPQLVDIEFYPVTTTRVRVIGALSVAELEVDSIEGFSPTSASIAEARAMPDESAVQLSGVTTAVFPDAAYLEATDRSSAIRIEPSTLYFSGPNLARLAMATASTVPNPTLYPPSLANDGDKATEYWPGALTSSNNEWIMLKWPVQMTFSRVLVHFLQHPSMWNRTIRLQAQTQPGAWSDIATTTIPAAAAPHCVADFQLASPVTADSLRVVNLLDLFELEVYDRSDSPAVGCETIVRGLLVSEGNERLIIPRDIDLGLEAALRPVGMTNRALQARDSCIPTDALLVTTWGTVVSAAPAGSLSYLYVDDGSGAITDVPGLCGVRVGPVRTTVAEGDFVSATGIVRFGQPPFTLQVRSADDVVLLNLEGQSR